MMTRYSMLAGAALALLPVDVFAQAPPAPPTPPAQTAPSNPDRAAADCTPTEAVPREGTIAPRSQTTGRADPLGERLAQSGGVLCPPPGIDPEMHAPTPQGGTMPVIPPPDSPGGDPSIRPK